jgi:hypothetical protein
MPHESRSGQPSDSTRLLGQQQDAGDIAHDSPLLSGGVPAAAIISARMRIRTTRKELKAQLHVEVAADDQWVRRLEASVKVLPELPPLDRRQFARQC